MLKASSASGIRDAIGSVNYPYTTDFQGGVEATRNLTSITSSDGYYFNTSLTSIYVGSNVTSIGDRAFGYCSITEITIPDTVTSLGSYAFGYCTSLTNVTLSNSITVIEIDTFRACSSLLSVTIPDVVNSIGSYAFYNCSSLPSVTIGSGVTSIENYVFFQCSSLDTINCLATTAPTLGSDPFYLTAATEIHVPAGATGYGATYGGLTVIDDL